MFTWRVLYFKMGRLYNYKIKTMNILCQSAPPSKYFYCIHYVREAEWRPSASTFRTNTIHFHTLAELSRKN